MEKISDNTISRNTAKQNGSGSKLARKLRISMLVTLIFFAYSLLAVLSTTDMMLLREGVIALPIIQASVPVVEFYRIAPFLLVLLHLHLLATLILYAREIYDSEKSSSEAHGWFCKSLIILFSFEQRRFILGVKNESSPRFFIRISFLIIFGAIPVVVLLMLQARFLAYQNELITLYHQSIITIDLGFQYVIMCNFYNLFKKKNKLLYVSLRKFVVFVFIVLPILFVWTSPLIPGGNNERIIKFDLQQSFAGYFFKDWWKKEEDQSFSIIKGERYINIQSKVITLRDPPSEVVGATIQMENEPNPEVHCQHVGEFDLSKRRLSFANFSDSKFFCVKMQGTQLNNSKLIRAKFSTVILVEANLKEADLSKANMSKADLKWVNLNTAILVDAILNEADLSGADLSKSNLRGARLRLAYLSEANLSEANLRWADLSGADLSKSNLRGANLSWANLRGANLSGADLSGAELRRSDLSGANMHGAKVHGARLYEAQLYGTILEGAKLYGANFSGSTTCHTDLDGVDVEKPERWVDILNNIKRSLREAGYSKREIHVRLAEIDHIGASTPRYVLPTGTDHCVLYVERPEQAPSECTEVIRSE